MSIANQPTIQLLHEAVSQIVTIELKNGDIYRGLLSFAEDTLNCHLVDVSHTTADGRFTQMQHVFVRGSQIRFIMVPPVFQNSPLFRRAGAKGLGRKVAEIAARGARADMYRRKAAEGS